MDDYQLRQMSKEDLLEFEKSRLNMETEDNEYMAQRNVNLQMKDYELQGKYFKSRNTKKGFAPVKPDMPPQDADEKESTRKRRIKREHKMAAKQTKALNKYMNYQQKELDRDPEQEGFEEKRTKILQKGRIDWENEDLFSIRLLQEQFSPKYAFEHYTELKQKLDDLEDKIDFISNILIGFAQDDKNDMEIIYPLEYKIRLGLMRQMLTNGLEALNSAIEARGYKMRYNGHSDECEIVELDNKNVTGIRQNDNLKARKKLRKLAKNMDEYVADQLIEKSQKQLEPEFNQMRLDMGADPGYSFIPAEHFTDRYQFEAIKKMRDLMTENSHNYRANKVVIDKMYQEVYELMNVHATLYGSARAISNLDNGAAGVTSGKMQKVLNRRQEVLAKKTSLIQSRANYILEGMKHLLKGDSLSERARITMNEFVEQSEDEVIQQRNAAKEKADIYARKLENKKNSFQPPYRDTFVGEYLKKEDKRYLMFAVPGDNMSYANVMQLLMKKNELERRRISGDDVKSITESFEVERKKFILPYMQKVQDIDIDGLIHCTDEQLLERMDELQEMSIQAEQIMEIVKNKDPEDEHGRSILETGCRNQYDRMTMFSLKYSLIQSHALRARSLAMIRAYEKDALTPSCLSEGDEEQLLRAVDRKYAEKNGITREQLLTYAKIMLRRSEAMKNAAYRRYSHNQV